MQILAINNPGNRLGRCFPGYDNPNEDHFIVVHTPDARLSINNDNSLIEEFINDRLNTERCKGILFVKGVPYGGLRDRALADQLKEVYRNKVHFLSYAIARRSELSQDQENGFCEFFNRIQDENSINWDLIDPPISPESIAAALRRASTGG